MSREKALKQSEKMLNELYTKATPSITWKGVLKKYSGTDINFYEKHYLDAKVAEKILDKYKKLVGKPYANDIGLDWLNYAPTSKKPVCR